MRDAGEEEAEPNPDALGESAQGLGLDMAALQAQRVVDQRPPPAQPDTTEVWPEHWQALQLLLTTVSQFRLVAGLGGCLVMPAPASDVAQEMRWQGIRDLRRQTEIRALYLVMEGAAVRELNKALSAAAKH